MKGTLSDEEIEKMTSESNEEEDREFMEKVSARNKLESYIATLKQQTATKNIVNRLKSQDKNTIINQLRDTLRWLKANSERQTVKKDHFLAQLKKLRSVSAPTLAKLYSGSETLTDEELLDDLDLDTPLDGETTDSTLSADDLPLSDDDKPIFEETTTKKDEL